MATTADIGWVRAIATGAAIVVIGFVGAVEVPNLVVGRLDGLTSFARSLLATSITVLVVVGMAWVLRRLQGRSLI